MLPADVVASTSADVLECKFDAIKNVVPDPIRRWMDKLSDLTEAYPPTLDLHHQSRSHDRAVVEYERPIGSINCPMKQFHRPLPPRDDPFFGNVVPSLRYTQGNALDVGLGIVGADEINLRKKILRIQRERENPLYSDATSPFRT